VAGVYTPREIFDFGFWIFDWKCGGLTGMAGECKLRDLKHFGTQKDFAMPKPRRRRKIGSKKRAQKWKARHHIQ
jgi:hypothetical protein